MAKKEVLIASALGVLIIAAGIYMLYPREHRYSDDPREWVEILPDNSVKIDVIEATEGKGYYSEGYQQYFIDGLSTVFSHDGLYRGNAFETQYFGQDGEFLIQITDNPKPGDGVLEGMIVEKSNGEKIEAYIFLDGDWLNRFGLTLNVVWGSEYQNTIPFYFDNETQPGIFFQKVVDNRERFPEGFRGIRLGGIVVGDITQAEVLSGNISGKTIINLH